MFNERLPYLANVMGDVFESHSRKTQKKVKVHTNVR